MTARSRLKPEANADLERLGALVEAVQARLRAPGVSPRWDEAQRDWPEALALAASIEADEGWQLYAAHRDKDWEALVLYLDAPQLFFRSYRADVHVTPDTARWSYEMNNVVLAAMRARRKRLGRATPPYTEDVLGAMRERCWARWGRP